MEYAVILFLLKTRRKPMRTIDQGFKYLFDARAGNGEAAQPLRSPSPKRSARQQDSARPAPRLGRRDRGQAGAGGEH